jgi:phage gp36-like protein
MTYTALTRTISGLSTGQITTASIGLAVVFTISSHDYIGVIELIGSTTLVLEASNNLPNSDGTITDLTIEFIITGSYCQVSDLIARIGSSQLAQLTNDTENDTDVNTTVVTAMIARADRQIDSFAGTVYTVPFDASSNCDSIPTQITQLSVDLTIYYCFTRRFGMLAVPKDWMEVYNAAMKKLDDISNGCCYLDGNPTIVSKLSNITASDQQVNFNDSTNQMSNY